MLEGIKKAIGNIAPVLATALGGPLAGAAVATIGKALGLPSEVPPDQVLAALQQITPEQKLALIQADNNFKLEMAKIASSDLQAAYSRESELANSRWGWMSLGVQNFGALIVLAILIMLNVWAIADAHVDPDIRGQIINSDFAIIFLLVGYWWGKSKRED